MRSGGATQRAGKPQKHVDELERSPSAVVTRDKRNADRLQGFFAGRHAHGQQDVRRLRAARRCRPSPTRRRCRRGRAGRAATRHRCREFAGSWCWAAAEHVSPRMAKPGQAVTQRGFHGVPEHRPMRSASAATRPSASAAATPKPTTPGRFSVPPRRPRSWLPSMSGGSSNPLRTTSAPTPFGPCSLCAEQDSRSTPHSPKLTGTRPTAWVASTSIGTPRAAASAAASRTGKRRRSRCSPPSPRPAP